MDKQRNEGRKGKGRGKKGKGKEMKSLTKTQLIGVLGRRDSKGKGPGAGQS